MIKLSEKQKKHNARENNKRWRNNNLEWARERERVWYQKNIEKQRKKIREKVSRYRKANPQKFKDTQNKFYTNNPKAKSIHDKKYRENNKLKLKEVHKDWYKKNKDNVRAKGLVKMYGITPSIYNEMFEVQFGKCAICGKHQSELSKRLFIDHNHLTKKVRSLLCMKCNSGIGMFEDNSELLEKAIKYLKHHETK